MSTPIDPAWGDDWMALADATKEPAATHPEVGARFVPHPCHTREFTNLALELLLHRWAQELADEPIALVPTDHQACHACGAVLCGCEDSCPDLDGDACGHHGRPYCPGCAPHWCADCRIDEHRWSR